MELSLKNAVDILDVVKTLDWYSIVLWLSLVVPLYYILIKKLMPDNTKTDETSIFNRLIKWVTLPKAESWVLIVSVFLFIAGTIIAVRGQQQKEKIRNLGWVIKNHLINTGYYSMEVLEINNKTQISMDDIAKVAISFPKEFSIIYTNSGNPDEKRAQTLMLSDSASKNRLMIRSEKILAAYLNNDSVLKVDSIRDFDTLFKQNNLFTYAVIYKLIADSSARFSFNLMDPKDPSKGFGIVKLKT